MRCKKVADWIAAAGATVVVKFVNPKLGQVNTAGQVKAGGLVPDRKGATEVLDEAKKALETDAGRGSRCLNPCPAGRCTTARKRQSWSLSKCSRLKE